MNNWISVKDRLPELHKKVLVMTENQILFNRLIINGEDVKGKHCVMWGGGDKVTHWMPLPEKLKQEEIDDKRAGTKR